MIEVTQTSHDDPMAFEVTVRDGDGESHHQVTLSQRDFRRLSGEACPPPACIEAAFRFLLDREPKEAIMQRFDIREIARHFPEVARELPGYITDTNEAAARRA